MRELSKINNKAKGQKYHQIRSGIVPILSALIMQAHQFFYFKNCGKAMIEESDSADQQALRNLIPMYNYSQIVIEDQKEILKFFFRKLNFEMDHRYDSYELSNEQIFTLKQNIDRIYQAYSQKRLLLRNVEGVWPLLAFLFRNMNGMLLYLQFEKLLESYPETQEKNEESYIKQEYPEFNSKKYFQHNNPWKDCSKFMKRLRLLERNVKNSSFEEARQDCLNILRTIISEQIDYEQAIHQFNEKYNEFKYEVLKKSKESRMKKGAFRQNYFSKRLFDEGYIASEPDNFQNINSIFTKDEYLTIYENGNALTKGPIHRCKSAIEEVPESEEESRPIQHRPMEIQEDSVIVSTITLPNKKQRTTVYSKSPAASKKKRYIFGEDKPVKKKNLGFKRLSRRKVIERLFVISADKNLLFVQLKKDREKQKQRKKKTEKFEKIKRRIAYISDEEDEEIRTNTRKKKMPKGRRMEIESDPESKMSYASYERPDQYSLEEMEEESIPEDRTKKNKIARKHTPIKNYKQTMQHIKRVVDDLMSDEEQSQQLRTLQKIIQVEPILINKKQDKSLNYLKKKLKDAKIRSSDERNQKMENIQIKKLELSEQTNLFLTIDMQAYIDYLCDLNGEKQIKREVMNVSKELLNRQQKQVDIDLTLKIVALNAMERINHKDKVIWDQYRDKYIFPMLKYQIMTNIFHAISEIFDTFFESSNEQDLTFLNKFKQFMKIIYIRCHNRLFLKEKITSIIYDCLITPQRLTDWKKSSYDLGSAFVVLESPYLTGPRSSKYKLLSEVQNNLTLILSSFIFENLLLNNIHDGDFISIKKRLYLETLTKELNEQSMKDKLRSCIFKFTNIFHQYHLLYLPEMTDDYFIKVLNIIYISAHIMKDHLVNIQNYALIKQHVQFIKLIFKQFIDKKLVENPGMNKKTLLNIILVQNKFTENFKEPKMQGKSNILVIIYSSISNFILSFDCFKQEYFQDFFFKYLKEKLRGFMDQIVNKMDFYTLSSIFSLLQTLYRMKFGNTVLEENNLFKMQKKGKPLKLVEDTTKYDSLREIIVSIFSKIDQKYDQFNQALNCMIKEKNKIKQNRQNTIQLQQIDKKINTIRQRICYCSQIIVIFLKNFIFNPQSQYINHQQQFESISHFFFGLSFAIDHYYFIKYMKNKDINSALANKCKEILQHLFVKIPDFVPYLYRKKQENNMNQSEDSDMDLSSSEIQAAKKRKQKHDKLFKLYYQFITENISKMSNYSFKGKKEEQMFFISTLEQKDYIQPITAVYSSLLVSKFQTKDGFGNTENTMMKFITQSFILHHSKYSRIEKVVYYMKYLFKYLNNYILAVKHRGIAQQSALKSEIREHVIIKWHKEIVFTIFLGHCLKNNQNYFNLPVEELIIQIKKLRVLEVNQLLSFKKQSGYTHFLVSLQKCSDMKSLSSLLTEFYNTFSTIRQYSDERNRLDLCIYDLFTELQLILRKMQMNSHEKWCEALESIRILNFLLDWKTIKIQCIKSYLNDMQVISRAQSLISRIKITQSNLLLLLTFFMKIKNSSMNPYQIKDTMTIYIDLISKNHQMKQQQEEYQPKQQFKIFAVLRQCFKKNREIQAIGKQFLYDLNKKFWIGLLNEQNHSLQVNVTLKLEKFLQLMKDSYWQRSVYQKLLNQNRQIFQNLIKRNFSIRPHKLAGSDRIISCFEDMVYVCMIGEHSDFFEVKALIRYLLNKNSAISSKINVMKQIIDKFTIVNVEGNEQLNNWAKQEIKRLEFCNRKNNIIKEMIQMQIQ